MGPRVRGFRILFVEDHGDTLAVTGWLLRAAGHSVVSADCCASAAEAAKGDRFDLLITDIGLPDGDGRSLLPEIRRDYAIEGIVVSAFGDPRDVARSRDAGFAAHLVKPINFAALDAAIDQLAPRGIRAEQSSVVRN